MSLIARRAAVSRIAARSSSCPCASSFFGGGANIDDVHSGYLYYYSSLSPWWRSSMRRNVATNSGGGGSSKNKKVKKVRHVKPGEGSLVVSILGPPNAGKSTLFNRLMCKELNKSYKLSSEKKRWRKTGSKARLGYPTPTTRPGGAIVSATPGTTRDRRECVGRIGSTTFHLVDTAGVDGERLMHLVGRPTRHPELERRMMEQTLHAATSADLVLLMFDARVGVTSDLMETARWLRKLSSTGLGDLLLDRYGDEEDEEEDDDCESEGSEDDDGGTGLQRRVVVLANKLEGDRWVTDDNSPVMDHLAEAARVGFGQPIPISAEHGEGLADLAVLIDRLTAKKRRRLGLPTADDDEYDALISNSGEDGHDGQDKPLQLAILGRQNVGKSTLVNSLLREERVITGDMPGLTRDSIAVEWSWNGRPVKIVDTAGIRKATRRDKSDNIEDAAVQDAMRAMKVADVAVLVLDADARMLQRQELAIADAVVKEGRALVVAANKMDLLVDQEYTQEDFAKAVREHIETRFPILRRTPVVAMSSLTGESVDDLMPVVFNARDRWSQTIPTGVLNRWLEEVVDGQPPPASGGRHTKIKYLMQTKGRPPTFLLFCNTDELPESYLRYLTRNFQDTFQMFGMEVRMALKKSAVSNPYAKQGNKRGGSGIGGHEARKNRTLAELRRTGTVAKKGKRRRKMRR